MEWVNFKVEGGERLRIKNDAHAHMMNISEYIRWLIHQERIRTSKRCGEDSNESERCANNQREAYHA